MGGAALLPDIEKIHSAGRHLLALINDILDLSKIEAGRMELHVEPFEVATVVDDVATTIRPLVEKNGNRLVLEGVATAGAMRSDATRVRQVLLNLVSNACKFTERGTITLAARCDGEGAAADRHLRRARHRHRHDPRAAGDASSRRSPRRRRPPRRSTAAPGSASPSRASSAS